MTTEELTAEERADIQRLPAHAHPTLSKLLRLYDAALSRAASLVEMNAECIRDREAALSRAEAAERERNDAHKSADYWLRLETKRDGQRKAAESRLAEATALLKLWCAAARIDGEGHGSLYEESARLSATPAQPTLLERIKDIVMIWANQYPTNADARARVAMDRIYDLFQYGRSARGGQSDAYECRR